MWTKPSIYQSEYVFDFFRLVSIKIEFKNLTFDDLTRSHLNIGLFQYSDPHCKNHMIPNHCIIVLVQSLQVIFSQTSENLERQSSMASSTEEVSGTNDVSTDSKQHDTTDTEQKFGMYMREFDFLEYELESLEVIICNSRFRLR